jgi:hypothetical protein
VSLPALLILNRKHHNQIKNVNIKKINKSSQKTTKLAKMFQRHVPPPSAGHIYCPDGGSTQQSSNFRFHSEQLIFSDRKMVQVSSAAVDISDFKHIKQNNQNFKSILKMT